MTIADAEVASHGHQATETHEDRAGRVEVRFAPAIVLMRHEVFDALEALACAEQALLCRHRPVEAAWLAALFEILEDRVSIDPAVSLDTPAHQGGQECVEVSCSGSNSIESELTQ
ncbi:MAG: hypothetical protein ACYDD4_02390 [Acidimicrobiales bacterium]